MFKTKINFESSQKILLVLTKIHFLQLVLLQGLQLKILLLGTEKLTFFCYLHRNLTYTLSQIVFFYIFK